MFDTINNFSFAQLLVSSLLLTLKFCIAGSGWGAILASKISDGKNIVEKAIIALGMSVVCSGLFALLLTVLLATFDVYTVWVEWGCALAFLFSGVLFAYIREKKSLYLVAPGGICLFLAFLSIMLLPGRGEWFVGGWDPGIYLNQGISMANNGSRMHKGLTFSEKLTSEEQLLFRHDRNNRKQFAPGVLVDDENQALRFQFFPLTPALAANLYRCGGLRAAARMNHFAAVMSLIAISCFLTLVSGTLHAFLAVLILCLQPIFIWHLQMPISEMLQQFIIFAILIAYAHKDKGAGFMLVVFLGILASVLNRFSFLPFAAMLLAAGAIADRLTVFPFSKRKKWTHMLLVGMLAFAGILSWYSSSVAVAGWYGSIITGILFLTALSIFVVMIAIFAPLAKAVVLLKKIPLGYMALLWLLWVPFFIFAPPLLYRIEPTVDQHNLLHVLFYTGIVVSLCAWAGAMLVWVFKKANKSFRVYVLFATSVISVLMLRKFIEPIYPWATRRYLHVLVPFIAIMASYFLINIKFLFKSKRVMVSIVSGVILVSGVIELYQKDKAAWNGVEFNGITKILDEVNDIIPDNAIILVDHFIYATPLTCIYNRDVLVVSNMDKFDKALRVLARLAVNKPLYIVTVTQKGLGVFPSEFPVDDKVLFDKELLINKMIHHKNRHSFKMKSSSLRFRVYKATF